jgi:hypothetical protein
MGPLRADIYWRAGIRYKLFVACAGGISIAGAAVSRAALRFLTLRFLVRCSSFHCDSAPRSLARSCFRRQGLGGAFHTCDPSATSRWWAVIAILGSVRLISQFSPEFWPLRSTANGFLQLSCFHFELLFTLFLRYLFVCLLSKERKQGRT